MPGAFGTHASAWVLAAMMPGISSARTALAYLQTRRMSARRAVTVLKRLGSTAQLLSLFARFFPHEFQAQKFSLLGSEDKLIAAEIAFLRLVSQRLFPIPDYLLDEYECYEEGLISIPIEPLFGDWWNEDPEDLPLIYRLPLVLAGMIPAGEELEAYFPAAFSSDHRPKMDWERLEMVCRAAGTPLSALWLAVLITDHSTGNVWLDASYEIAGMEVVWTAENMEYLAEAFTDAQAKLDEVFALDEWLKQDQDHLRQAVALWVEACASSTIAPTETPT